MQVIRCPHCKEFIDARSAQCRFCHNPIDTLTTQVAAETQERVNAAYNAASWLRNVAGAYAIFVAIRNILPFFAIGSSIVLPIMFIALPIMLIRWWVRYGRLQTDDPDYPRAKRNWQVALLIWLIVPVVWVLLVVLLSVAR
jgi:hypothetical protein